MKSERRHKLQHNTLADSIANAIMTGQKYIGVILAGVLLILAIYLGISFWNSSTKEYDALAWQGYGRAMANMNPTDLEKVADIFPDHEVCAWALTTAGNLHLQLALSELSRDKPNREITKEELGKAIAVYTDALNFKGIQKPCKEQVLFGLGRSHETLAALDGSKEMVDKALENYQALVDLSADGAYAGLAETQIAKLNNSQTMRFLEDYAKIDPNSTLPATLPGSPLESLTPGMGSSLFQPSPGGMPGSPLGNYMTSPSLNTTPAAGESATTPSETTPASTTPVEETTPPAENLTPPADSTAPAENLTPPVESTPPTESTPPAESTTPTDQNTNE